MHRIVVTIIGGLITTAVLAGSAIAGPSSLSKGSFGVGVNFPGANVRYFVAENLSAELKGQFETGIVVAGLRVYKYLRLFETPLVFVGVEGDYVSFKSDLSKGTGYAGEIFVGGEYFVHDKFSVALDFGPAFVGLKDSNYDVSVSGLEFVVNIGLTYYLKM